MKVQRLDFAGVRLEAGSTTLLVDAIGDEMFPTALNLEVATARLHALITHRHTDHYDEPLLMKLLDPDSSTLICHPQAAAKLATKLPRVQTVELYEPIVIERGNGDFVAFPVPASDGFGDAQVSWVVDGGGRRIIHLGDTTWHGHWWNIGRAYGPFDAAFVPVNGAVVARTRIDSHGLALALDPSQAVVAATALEAQLAVPIHYGLVDEPGYTEVEEAEKVFEHLGTEHGLAVKILSPGEWLEWPEPARCVAMQR